MWTPPPGELADDGVVRLKGGKGTGFRSERSERESSDTLLHKSLSKIKDSGEYDSGGEESRTMLDRSHRGMTVSAS